MSERYQTRFDDERAALAAAAEREAATRRAHLVRADGDGWSVVATTLPARGRGPTVEGRGEVADGPQDPRQFITRTIPPYGP